MKKKVSVERKTEDTKCWLVILLTGLEEKRVGSVFWKCHGRQKYAKNSEETGSTFMTLYLMNIISLILADAFLAIACAGRTRRVTVV